MNREVKEQILQKIKECRNFLGNCLWNNKNNKNIIEIKDLKVYNA